MNMCIDPAIDELDWRIERLIMSEMEPEALQGETTSDTEENDQFFIRTFLSYEETWNEAAAVSEDDSVEDT